VGWHCLRASSCKIAVLHPVPSPPCGMETRFKRNAFILLCIVLSPPRGMKTDMVQACSPTHGLFPVLSPLGGMVTLLSSIAHLDASTVLSPPCGMETQRFSLKVLPYLQKYRSKPTVWDSNWHSYFPNAPCGAENLELKKKA
jgi:hypothetical protein